LKRDLYKNPNLKLKKWWERIPDSRELGTTKNKQVFSYEICVSCEIDLEDGVCPMCGYGKEEE